MAQTHATLNIDYNTSQGDAKIQQSLNRAERLFSNAGRSASSFGGPLGTISRNFEQFDKSLDAANSRVLAFGASAGIILGVQRAFRELVTTTVDIEKRFADINSILNVSNQSLKSFSNSIFNIAKDTGQSFAVVSDAAVELARQGLGIEESLERARQGLILVRLSGLDAASSIQTITAAINGFEKQLLSSREVVSKIAAVDQNFAVSANDLAQALSRVGSTADSAGVSFEQLLGIVTAIQQTTTRGGSVIGNALKSVFTRIERPEVLDQLRQLGFTVNETQNGIQKLQEVSRSLDVASPAVKSIASELLGGVYQINIVTAALKDLQNQYSVTARATQLASNATNEAEERNQRLNQTLASLSNKTLVNFQQVFSQFGKLTIGPALERTLGAVNTVLEGAISKESNSIGEILGKGILKGLGETISGPGLALVLVTIGKLIARLTVESAQGLRSILGLNEVAKQRASIEQSVAGLLRQQPQLIQLANTGLEGQRAVLEKINLELAQTLNYQKAIQSVSNLFISRGTPLPVKQQPKVAVGFIPEMQEKAGAYAGGYTPGQVKEMSIPKLGNVYYNTAEKVKYFPNFRQPAIMPPAYSKAGQTYKKEFEKSHGFNPYKSGGYVPNYTRESLIRQLQGNLIGTRGLPRGIIEAAGMLGELGLHPGFIKNNPVDSLQVGTNLVPPQGRGVYLPYDNQNLIGLRKFRGKNADKLFKEVFLHEYGHHVDFNYVKPNTGASDIIDESFFRSNYGDRNEYFADLFRTFVLNPELNLRKPTARVLRGILTNSSLGFLPHSNKGMIPNFARDIPISFLKKAISEFRGFGGIIDRKGVKGTADLFNEQINIPKGASSHVILHELGHRMHLRGVNWNNPNVQNEELGGGGLIAQEKLANRFAVNFLKKSGASEEIIRKYLKNRIKPFKSYIAYTNISPDISPEQFSKILSDFDRNPQVFSSGLLPNYANLSYPQYPYPKALNKPSEWFMPGLAGDYNWKNFIKEIDPRKFTQLAATLPPGQERFKLPAVLERLQKQQPLDPLALYLSSERGFDRPFVRSHEGRHRALGSAKLGINKVPTAFNIYNTNLPSGATRVPKFTDEDWEFLLKGGFYSEDAGNYIIRNQQKGIFDREQFDRIYQPINPFEYKGLVPNFAISGRGIPDTTILSRLQSGAQKGLYFSDFYDKYEQYNPLIGENRNLFNKLYAGLSFGADDRLVFDKSINIFKGLQSGRDNFDPELSQLGLLKTRKIILDKILRGEPLESRKTSVYYNALSGDRNALAIDRNFINTATNRVLSPGEKISVDFRRRLSNLVRGQLAPSLGLDPRAVQAAVFAGRSKFKPSFESFERGFERLQSGGMVPNFAYIPGVSQLVGRLVTNLVSPYGYNMSNKLHALKDIKFKDVFNAVVKDKKYSPIISNIGVDPSISPSAAIREFALRKMFRLSSRSSVGNLLTQTSKKTYEFNPYTAAYNEIVEGHGNYGPKMSRGPGVESRVVDGHSVMARYVRTETQGSDKIGYEDKFNLGLNKDEKINFKDIFHSLKNIALTTFKGKLGSKKENFFSGVNAQLNRDVFDDASIHGSSGLSNLMRFLVDKVSSPITFKGSVIKEPIKSQYEDDFMQFNMGIIPNFVGKFLPSKMQPIRLMDILHSGDFSPKQRQVMSYASDGLSTTEIASQLRMNPKEVEEIQGYMRKALTQRFSAIKTGRASMSGGSIPNFAKFSPEITLGNLLGRGSYKRIYEIQSIQQDLLKGKNLSPSDMVAGILRNSRTKDFEKLQRLNELGAPVPQLFGFQDVLERQPFNPKVELPTYKRRNAALIERLDFFGSGATSRLAGLNNTSAANITTNLSSALVKYLKEKGYIEGHKEARYLGRAFGDLRLANLGVRRNRLPDDEYSVNDAFHSLSDLAQLTPSSSLGVGDIRYIDSIIDRTGLTISDVGYLTPRKNKGLIPNFNALTTAIRRENNAGVPLSKIRVGQSPILKAAQNPLGLGVYNTIHEPQGISQGINRALKEGANPKTYGVPNFAPLEYTEYVGRPRQKEAESALQNLTKQIKAGAFSFLGLSKEIDKFSKLHKVSAEGLKKHFAEYLRAETATQTVARGSTVLESKLNQKIADQNAEIERQKNVPVRPTVLTRAQAERLDRGAIDITPRVPKKYQDQLTYNKLSQQLLSYTSPKQLGYTPQYTQGQQRLFSFMFGSQNNRPTTPPQPITPPPIIPPPIIPRQSLFKRVGNKISGFGNRITEASQSPDFQNKLLLSSLLLPVVAGAASEAAGTETAGQRGLGQTIQSSANALSYGALGLQLGGRFGAKAGIAGFAAGAALELPRVINAFKDKTPELTKELEKLRENISNTNDAFNQILQANERLNAFSKGELQLSPDQYARQKNIIGSSLSELISKNPEFSRDIIRGVNSGNASLLTDVANRISIKNSIQQGTLGRQEAEGRLFSNFSYGKYLSRYSEATNQKLSNFEKLTPYTPLSFLFPTPQGILPKLPENISESRNKEISSLVESSIFQTNESGINVQDALVKVLKENPNTALASDINKVITELSQDTSNKNNRNKLTSLFGSLAGPNNFDLRSLNRIIQESTNTEFSKAVLPTLRKLFGGGTISTLSNIPERNPRQSIAEINTTFIELGKINDQLEDFLRNLETTNSLYKINTRYASDISNLNRSTNANIAAAGFSKYSPLYASNLVSQAERENLAGSYNQQRSELVKNIKTQRTALPQAFIKEYFETAGNYYKDKGDVGQQILGQVLKGNITTPSSSLEVPGRTSLDFFKNARYNIPAFRPVTGSQLGSLSLGSFTNYKYAFSRGGIGVGNKPSPVGGAKLGEDLISLSSKQPSVQQLLQYYSGRTIQTPKAGISFQDIINRTKNGGPLDPEEYSQFIEVLKQTKTNLEKALVDNTATGYVADNKFVNQVIDQISKTLKAAKDGTNQLSIDLTEAERLFQRKDAESKAQDRTNRAAYIQQLVGQYDQYFSNFSELEALIGKAVDKQIIDLDRGINKLQTARELVATLDKDAVNSGRKRYGQNKLSGQSLSQLTTKSAFSELEATNTVTPGKLGEVLTTGFAYNTQDYYRELIEGANQVSVVMKESFSSAFRSFVDGSQTAEDAARQLGISISTNILGKIADMGFNSLLGNLFNFGQNIFQPKATGGLVRKYASGGLVYGGSGVRDDVPAGLPNGAFVIKKSSVNKYGANTLAAIERNIGFANGGINQILKNEFTIKGRKQNTKGSFNVDSKLSTIGQTDENNPSNLLKFAKEQDYIGYQRTILEYQRAVKNYENAKRQRVFGALLSGALNYGSTFLGPRGLGPSSSPEQYQAAGREFGDASGLGDYSNYGKTGFSIGKAAGGIIRRYSLGGRTDSVPSLLTAGEYVMSPDTVRRMGVPFMEKLNAGHIVPSRFAVGGLVGDTANITSPIQQENGEWGKINSSLSKLVEINQELLNINSNKSETPPSDRVVNTATTPQISIIINVQGDKVSGGQTSSTNADGSNLTEFANLMKSVALNAIIEQQRNGGLLSNTRAK